MAPSTAGPAVPGTTTDEVLHLAGRTYRNRGVVTEVEPGRRLVWRTTAGADARGSRTVQPTDDGRAEVELVLEVRTHGVERLLQPILAPMLRKGLQRDLARLADLMQRDPVRADAYH